MADRKDLLARGFLYQPSGRRDRVAHFLFPSPGKPRQRKERPPGLGGRCAHHHWARIACVWFDRIVAPGVLASRGDCGIARRHFLSPRVSLVRETRAECDVTDVDLSLPRFHRCESGYALSL